MLNLRRQKLFPNTVLVLLLCLFFKLNTSAADEHTNDQQVLEAEINHLFGFIENSECTFIRNGTIHTSEEAIEHIQKKYDHFKKKIVTAEDFVSYSATGSLISKKPYHIQCPDSLSQEESADWLLGELSKFRASQE